MRGATMTGNSSKGTKTVPYSKIANDTKRLNIIDMSLTYTAMMRVFAVGSKVRIAKQFAIFCETLRDVKSAELYETHHKTFCAWFVANIKTAEKSLKNKKTKISAPASYGQAAKVLDIAAKVYVHYCNMPDPTTAPKILPFLHGAIDTPILDHLKESFRNVVIDAATIEGINEDGYKILQGLVRRDIQRRYDGKILPVAYDDIMWNQLNRS
jgi:hypothetical protein